MKKRLEVDKCVWDFGTWLYESPPYKPSNYWNRETLQIEILKYWTWYYVEYLRRLEKVI
jgi:hypothetical protein